MAIPPDSNSADEAADGVAESDAYIARSVRCDGCGLRTPTITVTTNEELSAMLEAAGWLQAGYGAYCPRCRSVSARRKDPSAGSVSPTLRPSGGPPLPEEPS